MKYFSKHLLKESDRRTRIPSILYLVIAIGFACFTPVFRIIQRKTEMLNGGSLLMYEQFMGRLFWVVVVCNIFLVIKLYSYNFSRKGSDFYHALPFTRQCVFLTNYVLLIVRNVFIIGISLLAEALIIKIDGVDRFDPMFILYAFIHLMVVALMVISAYMIAVSLSGTIGFAVVLGLLILVFPRFVYMLTLYFISSLTIAFNPNYVVYFSRQWNVFIDMGIKNMTNNLMVYNEFFVPGILCSVFIAIAEGICGLVLFMNRKSEYAECHVPGPKTDFVVHILVTLTMAFPTTTMIISEGFGEGEPLVLGSIAIILFLVYSANRRKGIKGFLKVLPRLGVVALLCLIYTGLINGMTHSVLAEEIESGDVEKVQILYDNGAIWYDTEGVYDEYGSIAHHDICYTDKDIINLAIKGYNRSLDDAANETHTANSTTYDVRFYLKDGTSVVRTITLYSPIMHGYSGDSNSNEDESYRLNELVNNSKELQEFYRTLPEELYTFIFKDNSKNDEIAKLFKEEYEKLSDAEKGKVIRSMYSSAYDYYTEEEPETNENEIYNFSVEFSTYYNLIPLSCNVVINEDLMPKTYEYCVNNYLKEKCEELERISKAVNDDKNMNANFEFSYTDEVGTYYYISFYYNKYDDYKDAGLNYSWSATEYATNSEAVVDEGDGGDEYIEIDVEYANEATKKFLESFKYSANISEIDVETSLYASGYDNEDSRTMTVDGIPVEVDEAALEEFVNFVMEHNIYLEE